MCVVRLKSGNSYTIISTSATIPWKFIQAMFSTRGAITSSEHLSAYSIFTRKLAFHQGGTSSSRDVAENTEQQSTSPRNAKQGLKLVLKLDAPRNLCKTTPPQGR